MEKEEEKRSSPKVDLEFYDEYDITFDNKGPCIDMKHTLIQTFSKASLSSSVVIMPS